MAFLLRYQWSAKYRMQEKFLELDLPGFTHGFAHDIQPDWTS